MESVRCPKCGKNVDSGSVFCTFCGEKLPIQQEKTQGDPKRGEKIEYCRNCGGVIDNATKKCTSCGKQFFNVRMLLVPALIAVILISLIGNWVQYKRISDLIDERQKLNEAYATAFSDYKSPSTGKTINSPETFLEQFTSQQLVLSEEKEEESTPSPPSKDVDFKGITLHTVKGNKIEQIGYDSDLKILLIKFKISGAVYAYSDVPITIYNGFYSAGSIDGYYDTKVRLQYDSERVN